MQTMATRPPLGRQAPIRQWVGRHPLAGFFILAYAGAWLALAPPVLAQNGIGLLPLHLPLAPFLVLSSFAGPAVAAIVVSGLTEGRAGVERLFGRYLIKPRRTSWYLLALFGPLEALVLGSSAHLGRAPLEAVHRQPAMVLSTYLAYLVSGLFVGPLGEELGWRGFALPRMQLRAGPLIASLALGVFWATWHLPLFALREWTGSANPLRLAVSFYAWVIPFTVVATWVYNRSRGSLTVATMLHAAENAAVGLVATGMLPVPHTTLVQAEVYGAAALLLVACTRGTLGLGIFLDEPPRPSAIAGDPGAGRRRMSRRQLIIGVVGGLLVIYLLVNIGYDIVHGAGK